jgi:hypothetical protein
VWNQLFLKMKILARISTPSYKKNVDSTRWIWYVSCINLFFLFQCTMIKDVVYGSTLTYLFFYPNNTLQLFFPLVFEDHWVLICVSRFMKQIAFFDSLTSSKESSCLQRAKNLVTAFLFAASPGLFHDPVIICFISIP